MHSITDMALPRRFESDSYAAINGSIHTLPTEVKMYFIVLCAGICMLFRWRRTILLVAVCMLAFALFDYDAGVTALSMPSYGQAPMAMFFAGVALFAVADRVDSKWWLVGLCLCITVLTPRPWSTAFALAAAAAAMIAVGRMQFGWRPKSDVSYGVYIYGWPCQQFILTFFPGLNPYVLFGAALLLSWGFAVLSWRIVEKPAIVFGQGLTATWTEFRRRGGLSAAMGRLLSIAALPRFATICVIFLLCVGMSMASERISITPITPLHTTIVSYGPTETRAGQGFNVQPSGVSAIWVKFDNPPPRGTLIVFDGEPLDTTLSPNLATAAVPNALFARAGDKPVLLQFRLPGQRQQSAPVIVRVTR